MVSFGWLVAVLYAVVVISVGASSAVERPHRREAAAAAADLLPRGEVDGFYSLRQVEAVLAHWREWYPEWVAPAVTIGTSVEGRPLVAVCVGADACASPPARGGLLLTALHHAREPLGLNVVLAWVAALLSDAAAGVPDALDRLAAVHTWVVPMVNPDAYAVNLAADAGAARLGRKNRRVTCDAAVDSGVDLNRNYDFAWSLDNVGSSPQGCAEDYRGSAAASEPEVAAVTQFVLAHRGALSVALNYHSYGRFINVPYAVPSIPVPHETYARLLALAADMAAVTGFNYGHPWTGGLYPCNGEASDWMVATGGLLAVSPELGPAFDDPFLAGMWPAEAALPGLVTQALTLTRAAYDMASTRYELAVVEGAAGVSVVSGTLRVRGVVHNAGLLDAAGNVSVLLLPAVPTLAHAAFCGIPGAGGPQRGEGVPERLWRCTLPLAALGLGLDGSVPQPPSSETAALLPCAAAAPHQPFVWPAPPGASSMGRRAAAVPEVVDTGAAAAAVARAETAAAAAAVATYHHGSSAMNATLLMRDAAQQAAKGGRRSLRTAIAAARALPSYVAAAAAAAVAARSLAADTCGAACAVALDSTTTAHLVGMPPLAALSAVPYAADLANLPNGGDCSNDSAVAYAVVTDDAECAVYAVTCTGIRVLRRPQAGCLPCALARTPAWAAAVGLVMPSPTPSPAPEGVNATSTPTASTPTASPPAASPSPRSEVAEEWPWAPLSELSAGSQAAIFGAALAFALLAFGLGARTLLRRAGVTLPWPFTSRSSQSFQALPTSDGGGSGGGGDDAPRRAPYRDVEDGGGGDDGEPGADVVTEPASNGSARVATLEIDGSNMELKGTGSRAAPPLP